MRVAIIGTPRSGNSLLRKVLAAAYGLGESASHDPAVLTRPIADNTVLQIHAPYSFAAHRTLRDQGVIIVTPRRHPLDIALSMLHFAQFEPDVSQWLLTDSLRDLGGCDPSSRAFREFVLGPGFGQLLGVTVGWWAKADVPVPYTALEHDPLHAMRSARLAPFRRVASTWDVARTASFDGFRATANMHGWMGRSGYWGDLIPRALAEEVGDAHPEAFRAFDIDAARDLDVREVRRMWARRFEGEERGEPHRLRIAVGGQP